ncbi:uncharacterized protein LOC144477475 [Augochlora pura]
MAALALAGEFPFELQAGVRAYVYRHSYIVRRARGAPPKPEVVQSFALRAWRLAWRKWRGELSTHTDERVAGALLPHFHQWQERRHGRLTYCVTQLLTGHGCFGEYLCRIAREATAVCHHCGADMDSAQHTLEVCPAFAALRRVLVAEIGVDLSLPAVIGAMPGSERGWYAAISFCEEVMKQKETAERGREATDPSCRNRKRRPRRDSRGIPPVT